MSVTKPFRNRRCSELRSEYNDAFAGWAKQQRALQARAADPSTVGGVVEEAAKRTRRAEAAYRESRNRLCECLNK